MSTSDFHVYLELGMTSIEFRELMTALSLAPDCCPSVKELCVRLYEAKPAEGHNEVWHYEEVSPAVLVEQDTCESPGCMNKIDPEDFDTMCASCSKEFLRTHHFVHGHGPGTGWVPRG